MDERIKQYEKLEVFIETKSKENREGEQDRNMERVFCLAMLECMDKIDALKRSRVKALEPDFDVQSPSIAYTGDKP